MDFPQFFKVLDSVITKSDIDFSLTEDNYQQFLINRYLSFISPQACILVNQVFNDMSSFPFETQEEQYRLTKAVFPKMRKQFIKYKRKPSVEKLKELEITDEEIEALASMLEVSKREIRDEISFLNEIEHL